MSATGDPGEASPEHRYFQAIEEIFVRLRGAPLLLSPADWQVARRWHEAEIPLEVVERAMEEVFARRRQRGTKGRVSSLRYCAPVVEAAWEEIQSLTAAGRTAGAAPLDAAARLAALADALPAALPERDGWQRRIRGLTGDTEAVEEGLARLDEELLDGLDAAQEEADRVALEGELDAALTHLAVRLPRGELAAARRRLLRHQLRRRWRLPVLSLFSPEAEGESPAGDPPSTT